MTQNFRRDKDGCNEDTKSSSGQGFSLGQGLSDLLRQAGIWVDADGDGEIDECRALLVIGRENSAWENLGCLDIAAALGLACLRFSEPVCLADDDPELETALRAGRVPVLFGRKNRLLESFRAEQWTRLPWEGDVSVAQSGALIISGATEQGVLSAARHLARELARTPESCGERDGMAGEKARVSISYVLNHLACRDAGRERSLGNLFAPGVDDRAVDAGSWAFRLSLPGNASADIIKAAAEFAARIGLEATGLAFPLGYLDGELRGQKTRDAGLSFRVRLAAQGDSRSRGYIRVAAGGAEIEVGGGEKGIIEAFHYLAHRYPLLEPAESSALFYTLRDLELETLETTIPDLDTVDLGLELEQTWASDAEFTRVWTIWNESVLPKLGHIASEAEQSGGPDAVKVHVELRTSCSLASRERIRRQLLSSLAGQGIQGGEVVVYPVHKQGFAWVTQTVLPRLAMIKDGRAARVERVDIEFRRLAPPPGEAYLDLPIRWLQELYPADELIAARLGISKEQVRFLMRDSGPTYRVTAYDSEGCSLGGFCFDPAYSERFYLEEFPELGKIHPPTGCLKVTVTAPAAFAGEVVNERVKTNPEDFWDWYQKSFLREVGLKLRRQPDWIRERLAQLQPFFERTELDVEYDGDDYPLGVREERFSPLESLHEDLYFVTLDYFATLGRHLCGHPFRAPGSIWPDVRPSSDGRFSARVKVKTRGASPQVATAADDRTFIHQGYANRIVKLEVDDGASLTAVELEAGCTDREQLERALAEINEVRERFGSTALLVLEDGALCGNDRPGRSRSEPGKHSESGRRPWRIKVLRVLSRDQEGEADGVGEGADGSSAERAAGAGRTADERINEHSVITMELLEKHLIRLGRMANGQLRVRPMGFSLCGRRCYAVEAVADRPAHLDGRVKHGCRKPTLLINARHHANEVSSTSAVLRLLEMCGVGAGGGARGDTSGGDALRGVNLVVIPMENVDGVAVHEKLQREHPTWSLHAARFSALGSDFYVEYFNPKTVFAEARVLPQLWWEWQPWVLIDAHGVPSHEWVQEFAGHNSGPYFPVSYWLPGALFYGIELVIEAGGEPGGAPSIGSGLGSWPDACLQARLKDAIIEAINANDAIRLWNETWLERYQKYAACWCPEKFPASVTNGVMFLSRPAKPDGPTFTERFGLAAVVDGVASGGSNASENGAALVDGLRIPVHFVFEVADETAQGAYLDLCAQAHLTGMLAVARSLDQHRFSAMMARETR